MNDFIISALSILGGGGLTWIATIKWTRKQAEADAMESVQNVYQELIQDLKTYNGELKSENATLREELQKLHDRLLSIEKQCEENSRKVDAMRPFICSVMNCPNRKCNADF